MTHDHYPQVLQHDFHDSTYEIDEKIGIRNRYEAKDAHGKVLLKATREFFNPRATFHIENNRGNNVLKVEADGFLDVSGDYTLYDVSGVEETPIAVFEKHFTIGTRSWALKTPDGERTHTITTDTSGMGLLKKFTSFWPYQYTIEDQKGREVGKIEGEFSIITDNYTVNLHQRNIEAPPQILVIAAFVIDALDENRD